MSRREAVVKAFRRGGRRIRIKIADQREKLRAARALRPKKSRGFGRMRAFGVDKKRYRIAMPVLVALIVIVCAFKYSNIVTARFRPLDTAMVNPLMGWAVDARVDPDSVEIDHSLVYATLTWRDFEREMGAYDFDSFEETNRLNEWWSRGKRAVIRFVMDSPGEEKHMDIPDWLYEGMGDDAGYYYENALGKGFSPNYTNIWLMNRHKDAIMELGKRYDDHYGIAFVEIGSVGHDGSWTTRDVGGDWSLPPNEDISKWIWHYTRAFNSTRLLASRPYQPVRVTGMGLFNDRLGNQSATWDWIDTIEYGGYDPDTGAEFRAMPEILTRLLSAARIDRNVSNERLFTLGLDSLIKQIGYCHTTYASGIEATGLSEDVKTAMSLVLNSMGYRLWVRECVWPESIRAGYCLSMDVSFRDDGKQGFMYDWPIEMSLLKENEVVFKANVENDIRDILPGNNDVTLRVDIPEYIAPGKYNIAIAILDPSSGKPAVDLAMDAAKIGLRTVLGAIEIYR